MAGLVLLSLVISTWGIRSQVKKDIESHKKDPSSRTLLLNKVGVNPAGSIANAPTYDEVATPANPGHLNTSGNDISLQKIKPAELNNSVGEHNLLEIVFKDLVYKVSLASNKTEKVILPGISGHLPAGKMSGLLGPTACGKSTLLNLLRKGGAGATSGDVHVLLKDHSQSPQFILNRESLPSSIGLVPQEDILDRSLTIRELLTFNAISRSRGKPKNVEEIALVVDDVLADLGIQHVADSVIGGGENAAANISGGQLKRVNIGCELVALSRPSVLLLDEPTAGLDAAIAYELILALTTLESKGITVFMTLQQPRAEIFERIDNLFLMSKRGGIVYEGKSSYAVDYLNSIGYPLNDEASSADYCVDVLNGLLDDESRDGSALPLDSRELHLLWKGYDSANGGVESGEGNESIDFSLIRQSTLFETESISVKVQSYLNLLRLNFDRLFTIRFRKRNSLITYMAINVIMSIALSVGFTIMITKSYLGVNLPPLDEVLQGFYPSPLQKYKSNTVSSLGFNQLLFFMSSALGCASALSAVPVFAGQESLIKREKSSGQPLIAYAVGRILADIFFVLVNGFVFAGIWCVFGHAGRYYDWMAVILCTAFASSGIGYITGAVATSSTASAWAIVIAFICSVFAGVDPSLKQVNRYPVVNWPWFVNYATWTAEATYYTWTRYQDNEGRLPVPIQSGANHYGFDVSHGLGRSVGAMIALGIGMRIIAVVFLWRKTSA